MVADAAKASAANYVFPLSPYYEDASLKDDAEGAYAEVMEAMSYDKTDSHELAQELTEAVNAAEAQA
jgi:oligogalacturonide transport system substrate-binding protein